MNLKFSGRGLAFLSHFKAEKDIRYYLNGVHFEPLPPDAGGGVIGAATNGHVLGMWHDRDGSVDRAVIATITRPIVMACKKPDVCLETVDGRLAAIRYEEINQKLVRMEEVCVQPNGIPKPRKVGGGPAWEVEGSFPNTLRVVREREAYTEGPTGAYEPKLLALMAAAMKSAETKAQRRFGCGIIMRQRDKDSGMLMLSSEMPEALAVVMPRRIDNGPGAPWLEAWRRHGVRQETIAATPLPGRQPSDAAPVTGVPA